MSKPQSRVKALTKQIAYDWSRFKVVRIERTEFGHKYFVQAPRIETIEWTCAGFRGYKNGNK